MGLAFLSVLPMAAGNLNEEDSRKFDYFFMEACRLKMHNDYQKAAEMFQNCLKIDNGSAIAHFELGKILLMAGDEKNAFALLKNAVELNPNNEWYQVYLAGIYERAKQLPKAIQVYEQMQLQKPEKIENYYHLGDLYTQTEQYDKAIAAYRAIEEREGMDEGLVLEIQRLYLLSGDFKSGLKELDRLLDKYPNQTRYMIMKGDLYLSIEDYKKALKMYDKVANIEPENGFLYMSLSSYYEQLGDRSRANVELKKAFASKDIAYEPKMQILLGYMMNASNDSTFYGPIEELTDILKTQYPEEVSTYFFYANLWINDTTKRDVVVQNLNHVITLDPSKTEAWMQLVQLSFQEGDFEQVLAYGQQAIAAGTKTDLLYFYSGIAAQQEKNLILATEMFSQALSLTEDKNPLKAQIYGSLGDVNYELKKHKLAFGYYEAALALDEHNVMVMNNYAYYLSEEDTLLAKAEAMSAKCIELEPGNPTFLDTYAWILYLRDNILLAKFYMEKAIHNIDEPNSVLYDHYGDILFKNGDVAEAIEYWQKAIDTGGDAKVIGKKVRENKVNRE